MSKQLSDLLARLERAAVQDDIARTEFGAADGGKAAVELREAREAVLAHFQMAGTIDLTCAHAAKLIEFADADQSFTMCVAELPERTADNGERMVCGLYAWSADYPEEGVLLLEER